MNPDHHRSPLNPVPWVVWLLVLPIAAAEITVALGASGLAGGQPGSGWRQEALQRLVLRPDLLQRMWDTGDWPLTGLYHFLSYPFVHGSTMHAIFALVFLLALGKFVGEVLRPWAVLVICVAATLAGGVVYSLVPGQVYPLYGAFPPVYGLIGAFTAILWARLSSVNVNPYRAFTLIGILIGVQVVLSVFLGWNPHLTAELAGFATGFVILFAVAPGGPARILARIRQR